MHARNFRSLICPVLALLMAGVSVAQDDRPLPSRDRTFRIPFQTQTGDNRIREIHLYYTMDQGRTWRLAAVASPEQGSFQQFTAPQDGLYWFGVRTLDFQGRFFPATEDGLRAGLKVLVDTQAPVVQLRALPGQGGSVGVAWDVRDPNLDLATFRLEYRPAGTVQWLPLPIAPAAAGQHYWNPASNATLETRLTIHDTVGNIGEAQTPVVPGPGGAPANAHQPPQNNTPTNTNANVAGNANVRLVNSKKISLNYRIDEVGPSGIAAVELWSTQDGRNWQKYAEDADQRPPFDFEVAKEGIYGFTLVVRSGVGLGDKPPQVGDAPQVWVEVDLTKPDVRLLNADVGRGADTGNLTITWTASDKNLGRQPITLSFSEHAEGPWTQIAANLENTGRYVWRMPSSGIPYRFQVRVEAADRAGNIGSAQTAMPVIVDLAKPKPIIIDVGPGRSE